MRSSVLRACATVLAASGAVLLGAGSAAAHVTADAPGAAQGGYSVVTFRVPTESDTAATTALTVTMPGVKSARTEPLPGWSAKVDRNDKSDAVAVTWTADAGNPGVGPGQFQRFVVSLGPLPEQPTVTFAAKQTYSDGKVVAWDQAAGPDGAEPEHPAPTITLAEAKSEDGHGHSTGDEHAAAKSEDATDDTARLIGGIALALGLLGVALGVGTVLRGRRS
ncbi:YcnI family copper-binding membrane protein [Nocardia bovistercoris]|uniref:YcnI family protein n=1 Tax=Nocardia bovistercoris TaxID=2785916 RepID=A0A931IEC0_9NOCA|nr:YcnI family protein [Nocardia bovistercoris]MBH0778936.1 YcnI family protein [Nocardia bovistercoris]